MRDNAVLPCAPPAAHLRRAQAAGCNIVVHRCDGLVYVVYDGLCAWQCIRCQWARKAANKMTSHPTHLLAHHCPLLLSLVS